MVFIPNDANGEEEYITMADIFIEKGMEDRLNWLTEQLSNVTAINIE
jgi:hypothetical protein